MDTSYLSGDIRPRNTKYNQDLCTKHKARRLRKAFAHKSRETYGGKCHSNGRFQLSPYSANSTLLSSLDINQAEHLQKHLNDKLEELGLIDFYRAIHPPKAEY